MPTVALLGTFDTKGNEYAFLRDRVRERGAEPLLIDAGVNEPIGVDPDVSRGEVAAAGGSDIDELAAAGDRGAAVDAMARGAAALVTRLHNEGRIDAIVGLGGSGGSAIATTAMPAATIAERRRFTAALIGLSPAGCMLAISTSGCYVFRSTSSGTCAILGRCRSPLRRRRGGVPGTEI